MIAGTVTLAFANTCVSQARLPSDGAVSPLVQMRISCPVLGAIVEECCPQNKPPEDWDWKGIKSGFMEHFVPEMLMHAPSAEEQALLLAETQRIGANAGRALRPGPVRRSSVSTRISARSVRKPPPVTS